MPDRHTSAHAAASPPTALPDSAAIKASSIGSVLTPRADISSRWNGALRTRLNRAPLEVFLRSQGQTCALGSRSAVSDNLASAAMFFLRPILPHCQVSWPMLCDPAYLESVGTVTSTISLSLAELIREPISWRVASLIASARLLSPALGGDFAARSAASAVGAFGRSLHAGIPDAKLGERAVSAVMRPTSAAIAEVRALLVKRLTAVHRPAVMGLARTYIFTTMSAEPPSNH